VWHPDVPPTSPHSHDEEFDGSSVSGNLIDWDPAGYMTASIDTAASMLQLALTGNGNIRVAGLYKAVPNSEFAVYTCCYPSGQLGATGSMCGLFVSQDVTNNPSTSDFRTHEVAATSSTQAINNRGWTSYTTPQAGTSRTVNAAVYLRMRLNGTACSSDISFDGRAWVPTSSVTLAFTPAEYGLCGFGFDNTVDTKCYFRFLRVFSGTGSSGFHATGIGGFLGSFV
jgi:hypothetical protein